jgi:crotonobetainyl-CoA:carnitine CoA-transferase CaiB-like acyl-CoA transferase
MTGYPDGPPMVLKGPCDPLAGLHAVVATLTALEQADVAGSGVLVEVPMVETALNAAAEVVIEHSAYGAELTRTGNRGPVAAPQNLYRCADGAWLALAVVTDDHWTELCEALDDPAPPERHDHDQADRWIAAWCASRDAAALAEELTARGIPAAPVVPPPDVLDNPQFAARGFAETVCHPLLGELRLPGLPVRLASRNGPWFTRPAPTLGEHNDEVLAGLDLATLRRLGVIGERPDNL